MKFDLTDDQQAVDETVRSLLGERLPSDRVRRQISGDGFDAGLWAELCDLGFAGLAVPAEHGGQGLGLLELGLVCEALGAALAPVPLLANAAAGLLVDATGSAEQRTRLLPVIAAGTTAAGFATHGDSGSLSLAPAGDGPLVLVSGGYATLAGPDAPREAVETIDLVRRYVSAGPGADDERLPGDATAAVDAIELMLAAELTGVAQRALDLAVAYAGEREQFGRKIGTFQGVSHRCATMLMEVETARSTWRYGCWVAAHEPDGLPLAASTAKVAAVDAALHATTGALQVLGGIGFTWEHDIHLLLRRARVGAQLLGNAATHRRRIARLVLDATPGLIAH